MVGEDIQMGNFKGNFSRYSVCNSFGVMPKDHEKYHGCFPSRVGLEEKFYGF